MRLIDADEFKKQIAGMAIVNNYPAEKANAICELIDNQPTAYDVDKAVEQLRNVSVPENKILYSAPDKFGVYVHLDDAIKIIKAGMKG